MLINTQGRGVEIYTPQKFTDVRIEMEVIVPKGSNSGIHAMGDSEVQVCDSFEKQNLNGGDVGAIHGASPRHRVIAKSPSPFAVAAEQLPNIPTYLLWRNGCLNTTSPKQTVIHGDWFSRRFISSTS